MPEWVRTLAALLWLTIAAAATAPAAAQAPPRTADGAAPDERTITILTDALADGDPRGEEAISQLLRRQTPPLSVRVLPIAGRGGVDNMRDLLSARGIDVAIVNSDVPALLDLTKELGAVRKRARLLTHLFDQRVFLLARPAVQKLADLKGRRIGVIGVDGASTTTARTILGLEKIDARIEPLPDLAGYAASDLAGYDAILLLDYELKRLTSLDPALRLTPIPMTPNLAGVYTAAAIEPHEVPPLTLGRRIETLGLATVLASNNVTPTAPRHGVLERFLGSLYKAMPALRAEKGSVWRQADPRAQMPGWRAHDLARPNRYLSTAEVDQLAALEILYPTLSLGETAPSRRAPLVAPTANAAVALPPPPPDPTSPTPPVATSSRPDESAAGSPAAVAEASPATDATAAVAGAEPGPGPGTNTLDGGGPPLDPSIGGLVARSAAPIATGPTTGTASGPTSGPALDPALGTIVARAPDPAIGALVARSPGNTTAGTAAAGGRSPSVAPAPDPGIGNLVARTPGSGPPAPSSAPGLGVDTSIGSIVARTPGSAASANTPNPAIATLIARPPGGVPPPPSAPAGASAVGAPAPSDRLTIGAIAREPLSDPTLANGGVAVELLIRGLDIGAGASATADHPAVSWASSSDSAIKALSDPNAIAISAPWETIDCDRPDELSAPSKALCAGATLSVPMMQVVVGAFALAESSIELTTAGVEGRTVCLPKDRDPSILNRDGRNWASEKRIAVIVRPSLLDCAVLVQTGEADVFVANDLEGQLLLGKLGAASQFQMLSPPLGLRGIHAAVSRAHPRAAELVAQIDNGVRELKRREDYAAILNANLTAVWAGRAIGATDPASVGMPPPPPER